VIWQLCNPNKEQAKTLGQELNLSPYTAQVLINRGINTARQAEIFLNPRLNHLTNPFEIPNAEKAAERVLEAKKNKEKIIVYGDYDVDGVTGTAILMHVLKYLGVQASYYIPHRYDEGYSLSAQAVKKIAEEGSRLIITVDCGISNVKEIAQANELGLDVIVTDHHNIPKELPPALALVNPKLIEQEHPAKDLSGAGVAFKFAWAVLKKANLKDVDFLSSLLDLAALGTLADVVPLHEENRILSISGLKQINQHKRLGLNSLIVAAGVKDEIKVRDVHFALAPRINAAGRLEHASMAVELFLTEDASLAQKLANELNQINVRRRGIGDEIKDAVFSRLDLEFIAKNKVVVLEGKNWHPGVIGIIASRVADTFYRPTILIGVVDGMGRGSARSVEAFNIFELLDSCNDLFVDFGGHERAAGFSIKTENIPELKQRLSKKIDEMIGFEDL